MPSRIKEQICRNVPAESTEMSVQLVSCYHDTNGFQSLVTYLTLSSPFKRFRGIHDNINLMSRFNKVLRNQTLARKVRILTKNLANNHCP